MNYRNITVNDRAYRWAVSKTHTKVRDVESGKSEVYRNDEWGVAHANRLSNGTTLPAVTYIVRPRDVRGMILGEKSTLGICKGHPDVTITGLATDPYSEEIYGKVILVDNCHRCLDQSGWDI
jgi:hypothetical protein